ncbi:glycosyl hydrolase family 18 protein [Peptoniphilus equinus]|uniref:Glycosyl hydrolase family 18 protein n=1 Tax=Peptoniphilus equinus TaxID=3016343 RepID=A0ABY7QX18_9FIRM|nr:glycosyl hydrolase family 18 protein [Peptoniphilus equinus]WBW50639.1 glycosyl hydrolase family 18 protein [Peptoniphilus equinus]
MKKLFIFLLLLLLAGGAFVGYLFLQRSNGNTSELYKGFNFIVEGDRVDTSEFTRVDGQYYLSVDFIKNYIDDTVAYDDDEKTVIFVNKAGTKRMSVDSQEATLNTQAIELRDPVIEQDGKVFVPIEGFIYDYPVVLKFIKEKNLLVMDYKDKDYAIGTSPGDGLNMRESDSIKSPIVSILKEGDQVYVYGEVGDFYKVREVEGYAGYIQKDKLDVDLPEDRFVREKSEDTETREAAEPLNLTWDYTYGNHSDESVAMIHPLQGVDVICPTWFSVSSKDGDMIDRGRRDYVEKYKNLGIDVWGYLDNSFDKDITTGFIHSSAIRDKVIAKTLAMVQKYNLSGINVDFEQTAVDDRDAITQFIRELAGVFAQHDLLVSVDVTPQISADVTQEPYDRKALAEIADYVIVMTYDQHWATSDKAGSVAEYNWVEGNINLLMNQIPQDKFMITLPFYARLWSEDDTSLKSDALSMNQVVTLLRENNATMKWDDKAKQNIATYTKNGKHYTIWVEDRDSIQWKTTLMGKYGLAGVGGWRHGFETEGIWDEIDATQQAMAVN